MKFSFGKYRQPFTLALSALILIGSGVCLGVGFNSSAKGGSVTVSGPSIDIGSVLSDNRESLSPVPGGKININTASVDDLVSLSGIGEKKARAIVEFREQSGLFGSIEEIQNVSGIGSGIFEKIRDSIAVE